MEQRNRRIILYLFFFLVFFGAAVFVEPYIALYLEDKGLDGAEIGLINGLMLVATLAGSFCLGLLADKTGRPALMAFPALLLGAAAVMLLAGSAWPAFLGLSCVLYGFFTVPVCCWNGLATMRCFVHLCCCPFFARCSC